MKFTLKRQPHSLRISSDPGEHWTKPEPPPGSSLLPEGTRIRCATPAQMSFTDGESARAIALALKMPFSDVIEHLSLMESSDIIEAHHAQLRALAKL